MSEQLTAEMVEKMEASWQLDRLIAEQVMQWKSNGSHSYHFQRGLKMPIYQTEKGDIQLTRFLPSANIVDAWMVVEKIGLFDSRINFDGLDTGFCFERNQGGQWCVRYRHGAVIARADSAPLAICKAALKMRAGSSGTGE
jgi:hypothetical protein